MALSIEVGIANTYALGVCFYVVCAIVIVANRQAKERLTVPMSALVPSALMAGESHHGDRQARPQ
jgi:hypothetical protein